MGKLKIIGSVVGLIVAVVVVTFFLIGYFRPQVAGIYIESNPAATVFVNSEQIGRTPFKTTREPGEVTIKLIPESFEKPLAPYETKVNLVKGVETVVKYDFGELYETSSGEIISFEKTSSDETSLVVVTQPDSAQISIDGAGKVFTPYKTQVQAGEHTILLSAPNYIERVVRAKIYEGYKLTAYVKLAASGQVEEVVEEPEVKSAEAEVAKEEIEIIQTPVGFLRVRKEPSTLGEEVGRVDPGERFPLLETDAKTGWFKIEFLPARAGEPAKSGWVSNQYAKKVVSGSPTPSPKVTPTVTPKTSLTPTPKVTKTPTPTP